MNEPTPTTPNPFGNETSSAASPITTPKKRSGWLPVFVLAGVFLIGFVPMWIKSSGLNAELLRAQRQSRVDQIQITFANATLDARRGDYESARKGAADSFSLIRSELDRGIGSALPASATEGLKPLLAQRDNLITLLARGDPASAERLANAYADFRKTLGK